MRIRFLALFTLLCLLFTAGCGFQLRHAKELPVQLRDIQLETNDPYSNLSRAIREELRLNGINIVAESSQSTTSLRILDNSTEKNTASVYRSGAAAENQMVMVLSAQLMVPNYGLYPLKVRINDSFFDNPRTALAKDAEQDMITKEMEKLAAKQLILQLRSIQLTPNK